jgi:ABC-type oligopeptide transport system substrate-binding subunit
MELVPLVARSWDITDEGQRYVFHLRDDVVWSDGVPVTAYDFAFAWRRVLSPDFPAPSVDLMYDVKGARAFRRGETTDPHTLGVRALSEGVLEVELEGPCAYFPYLLSFSLFYPVPRHAVEEHGLGWADLDRILTNGPFRIHSWEPGHSIELVRNPDYCGRCEGNVERVELSLLTDWPVILPRYREDELDVLDLWGLAMADVDRARQRHPEEYVTRPAPVTVHVRMNTIRAPLDDRRVRRALSLAVDQESLTNHVLGDFGSPAGGGFVPPGMPGYSPSIGLPYEPDRARRLLAEAGYPEGRGLPKLSMIAPNRPLFVQLGEFLQTRWKEELGIELLWQVMEWAELNPYLKSTPPHLFLVAWEADYFDPHSFLRSGIQSSNLHWRDAVYEQWVEEARRTVDREDRMALYAQVDRRLMEEAVSIPLVYPRHHFLIKPWVRRYPISAIRYWFWKDVILEPH